MIRGSIPLTCRDCGTHRHALERVFRNLPVGGSWIWLCEACRDGVDRLELVAVTREGVEPFTCVARPRANEVAFLFGDGFVTLRAAEARAIHEQLGGALAILSAEHPAQISETKGAA
jgi:hypothetical protein